MEFVFDTFTLANVPHHPGKDASLEKHRFVNSQLHRELAAILAQPHNLAFYADDMGRTLLEKAIQVAVVFGLIRLWHQDFHILADHLLGLIPEDLNRVQIEAFYAALLIDGDDGIRDTVQRSAQKRPLFTFTGSMLINLSGHFHGTEKRALTVIHQQERKQGHQQTHHSGNSNQLYRSSLLRIGIKERQVSEQDVPGAPTKVDVLYALIL